MKKWTHSFELGVSMSRFRLSLYSTHYRQPNLIGYTKTQPAMNRKGALDWVVSIFYRVVQFRTISSKQWISVYILLDLAKILSNKYGWDLAKSNGDLPKFGGNLIGYGWNLAEKKLSSLVRLGGSSFGGGDPPPE